MSSNSMKAAFSTFNGYGPKEGVKALPVAFDFSVLDVIDFDLLIENTSGVFQFVQSVWIDNSDNPGALTLIFGVTNQRIVAPAFSQGCWPVITVDQTRVRLSSPNHAAAVGQIILMNVPMAYTQSGPFTANVTAAAIAPVVADDFSDTIALGGASQVAIPANPARLGFLIQNPANEIAPLFVNFTDAASIVAGSVEILPGAMFPPNGAPYVSQEEITINAATTGHRFTAKEFI